MGNGRLHTDAHQAVGVVDRLPAEAGQRMDAVAAAYVVQGHVGTAVHQQPDDVVAALVRRAHERGATIGGVTLCSVAISGSAPCSSSSFMRTRSPDCAARRNGVAPSSLSHWWVN